MSEGTLQPVPDQIASNDFVVEYSHTIMTGAHKASIKLSDFPRVATLRTLFASVMVKEITAEARQDTLLSESDENHIAVGGHIFVALIPTNKDTDSASGSTSVIVNNVPNKQTFALSSMNQANSIFRFNLTGFETDLAQDPRRGAGPVAWIGNSGVKRLGKTEKPVCTVTWRLVVTCSGETPLWQ